MSVLKIFFPNQEKTVSSGRKLCAFFIPLLTVLFLGCCSPKTLTLVGSLGETIPLGSETEQLQESENKFLEVIQAKEREYGESHPEVAVVLNNYAGIVMQLQDMSTFSMLIRIILHTERRLDSCTL